MHSESDKATVRINDNILDDIAHKLSSCLEAYELNLTNEQKYDLSDTIQEFLRGRFDVEFIQENPDLRSNLTVIESNITAAIKQSIKIIDSNYDRSSVITGLDDKTLESTCDHMTDSASYITEQASGKRVAIILSQEMFACFGEFD